MVAGIVGCGVAQLLDTAVPYALYGIAASALVLLACAVAAGGPSGRPAGAPGEADEAGETASEPGELDKLDENESAAEAAERSSNS